VGGSPGPDWAEFLSLAQETGALTDSAVRQRLADWYVRAQGYHLTKFRTMTALSRGQVPGPEASIGKIITANQLAEITAAALELDDHYGVLTGPEYARRQGAFQQATFWAPGLRIAGGTDEILKNIIAERVLGLPADLRTDKTAAFQDLPTGV
jgi:alkylation response protein AidB-like acyl-CoA dehydrogenase